MTRNRCGDLFGYGDPLSELIKKAIDHGDDIDIPGIELTAFGSILQ